MRRGTEMSLENSFQRGTCFCGKVEIEVTGSPEEMGYCHCQSCRSYSGAPVSAYLLWKSENVRVTRGDAWIGRFNKTGMSERCFCTVCGGHLMTVHPGLGMTDTRPPVTPKIAFTPSVHLNYGESVMPMSDGIMKFRDFPAGVGGSGELMSEQNDQYKHTKITVAVDPQIQSSAP